MMRVSGKKVIAIGLCASLILAIAARHYGALALRIMAGGHSQPK